ncbi:hypothetical protein BO71DRAFT_425192 [Aspergillus ellipticus CBS 707.79]|uniref:C2H2-type domain-containing protein n=1 Tax=Aspergillus ellipticus CBS 707.79 TaxID=1448320 RepID=A0A319DST8_9EURO|nr:hypothetical protein BO71DRAFT_425192 [Aspergillus ellipticus CBS 707.79]
MSKRSRSTSPSPSPGPSSVVWSRSASPASSTTPSLGRSKIHFRDTAVPETEAMHCSLPPHRETLLFASYEDYEVHYMQAHVNRCSQCNKNFPTDRFLTLHIEENHDALVATRRDRGEKTYGCFIEGCERVCSTPQKRRMHLIDKHLFPKTYNFYIVNDGIDKQTSLLRSPQNHRRRLSAALTSPREGRLRNRQNSISQPDSEPLTQNPLHPRKGPDEIDIAQLETSMSALRFVPASVARTRGTGNKS